MLSIFGFNLISMVALQQTTRQPIIWIFPFTDQISILKPNHESWSIKRFIFLCCIYSKKMKILSQLQAWSSWYIKQKLTDKCESNYQRTIYETVNWSIETVRRRRWAPDLFGCINSILINVQLESDNGRSKQRQELPVYQNQKLARQGMCAYSFPWYVYSRASTQKHWQHI